MTSSSSPRERILAMLTKLPSKQRRLARFFLDHEDVVAFASANEISEQAGASAATVVRFCRALGYSGYTDLQTAIRAKFPQYRTAVQKLAERVGTGDFANDVPTKIAWTNTNNVQQSLGRVSKTDLAGAVSAIISARRICIFGSGLSAAVAVFAEHSFTTLGLSARGYIDDGLAPTIEVSQLTDRDVVVAISVWRYLRHTIELVKAARAAGATCIALTDSSGAPIATVAQYVFVAEIEGAVHSRSLTGLISLIDLISAAIVATRPDESMAALKRIDRLYRKNGLLWSD